jgi:hypothetical protein
VDGVCDGVCAGRVAGVCAGAFVPGARSVEDAGAGAAFGLGAGVVCAFTPMMKSMLTAKRKIDFFIVFCISY